MCQGRHWQWMGRNVFHRTVSDGVGSTLFAATVRLVIHAHRAEAPFAIAAAFRRFICGAGNLTGLLNPHAAGHDLAGIGSLGDQQW